MALTAAQYRDKAEQHLATAAGQTSLKPEAAVANAQVASVYSYLYVEQAKLDAP